MNTVHLLKRHKWKSLIFLILAGVGFYFFHGTKKAIYETTLVKRGNVVQEVSVTGRVEAQSEVALAFERGGRVVTLPRKVGTIVRKGDILIRLDTSELSALRAQAAANLQYEKVVLDELKTGARAEDIAVLTRKLDSATIARQNAVATVVDKLKNTYAVGDDAVHGSVDNFWRNPRTTNPELTIPISDAKLASVLPGVRVSVESSIATLKEVSSWANAGDELLVLQKLTQAESALADTGKYLDMIVTGVNGLVPSSSLSQATIDGYRTSATLARTAVSSMVTGLLGSEKDLRSAISALGVAGDELNLKKVGATPESLLAQEAKIAAVGAMLANYDAQITKMSLAAPFAGVVTKEDAKMGEAIAANTPLVTIQSFGGFQIVANIQEVDFAKIKLGDKVSVTLDAYGSEVNFPATVSLIDPAETVIEGISTYKVTLSFDEADTRIRSGMTANISIHTAERNNVLEIPLRAVTTKESTKIVRIAPPQTAKANTTPQEVNIVLGLRGSDGMVEVVSGLTEGEEVITFEQK